MNVVLRFRKYFCCSARKESAAENNERGGRRDESSMFRGGRIPKTHYESPFSGKVNICSLLENKRKRNISAEIRQTSRNFYWCPRTEIFLLGNKNKSTNEVTQILTLFCTDFCWDITKILSK